MTLPTFQRLNLRTESDGHVLMVDLNHGRVNEMGRIEIGEWAELTRFLHNSDVRAVITSSRKETRKGTPIFIAGANVTERVDWTDAEVRAHVRWQRETLLNLRHAPVFHIATILTNNYNRAPCQCLESAEFLVHQKYIILIGIFLSAPRLLSVMVFVDF